jgi:hypothetical protein
MKRVKPTYIYIIYICRFSFYIYMEAKTSNHRGGSSPESLPRIPGSILTQSMWNLWWAKWHSEKFVTEVPGCVLSLSFYQYSTFTVRDSALRPQRLRRCATGFAGKIRLVATAETNTHGAVSSLETLLSRASVRTQWSHSSTTLWVQQD